MGEFVPTGYEEWYLKQAPETTPDEVHACAKSIEEWQEHLAYAVDDYCSGADAHEQTLTDVMSFIQRIRVESRVLESKLKRLEGWAQMEKNRLAAS